MSDFERNIITTSIIVNKQLEFEKKTSEDYRRIAQGDPSIAQQRQKEELNKAEKDSNYWNSRALKAEKELKTIKHQLTEAEAKILEQTIAYDEAFQELVSEFGYNEEERQKIKKQHLRWKFRAEQILQKKEEFRKAEFERKANEPKQLTKYELDGFNLYNGEQNLNEQAYNQFLDYKTRIEYWQENGLYQDIKILPVAKKASFKP